MNQEREEALAQVVFLTTMLRDSSWFAAAIGAQCLIHSYALTAVLMTLNTVLTLEAFSSQCLG